MSTRPRRYTSIPVLVEVKEKLDALRGNMDWSAFLMSLVEENIRLKRILAARRIEERFSEAIEKSVSESSESMRGLKLREVS